MLTNNRKTETIDFHLKQGYLHATCARAAAGASVQSVPYCRNNDLRPADYCLS